MLARYMTESLKIPTATSFRTFAVTTLDARRRQLERSPQGRRQRLQGVVHAPDRLRDHPCARRRTRRWRHSFQEVDGKPHRVVPEHTNLGLAVDVQRDDGSRTLIVPVIKGARGDGLRRATARCTRT